MMPPVACQLSPLIICLNRLIRFPTICYSDFAMKSEINSIPHAKVRLGANERMCAPNSRDRQAGVEGPRDQMDCLTEQSQF
jgi:hypothetical protein